MPKQSQNLSTLSRKYAFTYVPINRVDQSHEDRVGRLKHGPGVRPHVAEACQRQKIVALHRRQLGTPAKQVEEVPCLILLIQLDGFGPSGIGCAAGGAPFHLGQRRSAMIVARESAEMLQQLLVVAA